MDDHLPLSALLSHALVAFIIEFDNEFELRTPHQTSNHGGVRGAPWLVSMAMWMLFLRHIPDEGIGAPELAQRWGLPVAEARRWAARFGKWWGYIMPGAVVRPTSGGAKAFAVWRGLTIEIEKRWEQRYGKLALARFAEPFRELPDFLPILGYGLWSKPWGAPTGDVSLPVLLSKVLLGFAVEYESQSAVSLAIAANVLRLVPDEGFRLRDLPRFSGVSKEAIAMATGYLEKHGFARIGPGRTFELTDKGRTAREEYARLVWDIERKWNVPDLRGALESIRITPPVLPPGTWRSKVARPEVLPDFPMILHRGGYPDGS